MSYKREMIFIIYYDDNSYNIEKYSKSIYNNYVKRTSDERMTYDRFRYIFKKYNFDEFLQPFFNRALENIKLCDKDNDSLSKYTRNKVFNNVKKLFESKECDVNEYDFTKPFIRNM